MTITINRHKFIPFGFSLFLFLAINISAEYFPQSENWEISSPEDQGVSSANVNKLIDLSFLDNSTSAVVVIKNGKIIGEKYADGYNKSSHGTSWSMAKSYYAALIGISLDKGEIQSLDENVANYLEYFNDERSKITIRDLLDMSSGLDFPSHEHEKMFFQSDHLKYAKTVGVEKEAGLKFEYNNVNYIIVGKKLKTTKEKKLNAIKSEILEITDFVTSNNKDKNTDYNKDDEIENNSNDTFTLTNIVNSEHKVLNKNDLTEVKDELNKLKSALIKQEILLKEILLKIK